MSALDHRPQTEVMTTVLLSGNPEWVATPLAGYLFLVQDMDANVGILGTRDQISNMLEKISNALLSVKERLV
jgi:hypothetical protein